MPTEPSSNLRAIEGLDFEEALPLPSRLQHRIKRVQEELEHLIDTATRIAERLPTSGMESGQAAGALRAPPKVEVMTANGPDLRIAEGAPATLTQTALGLVNDSAASLTVALRATSLVNDRGEEIPSRFVSFLPAWLEVPAGGQEAIRVAVSIPRDAAPGLYSGLVQAAGLDNVRAIVRVLVNSSQ